MKTPQSNEAAALDDDELYWMAVDIILDRYKNVSKQDLAKLAESVTEEAISSGLTEREKRRLLSKRITAAVRATNQHSSPEKKINPVGHDRLLTVGAKRQDHRDYTDTFNNTTEADPHSEYGDLNDNQLSRRHLELNERRLHEQGQARARIDHIERGVSPDCKKILKELRSRGGPGNGETTNSIAEAISIDHKTLERFFDEAGRADRWVIFGTPMPPLKSENPQRVYGDIGTMTGDLAEVIRLGPPLVSMETIRKTSGESALPVFEDKRTSVGRNPPGPPKARSAPNSPAEKLRRKAANLSKRWDNHIPKHPPVAGECEGCKEYVAKLRRLNEMIKSAEAKGSMPLQIPATFKSANFIWLGAKTRVANSAWGQ